MHLNPGSTHYVAVHGRQLDWTPSPIPGVDWRILDKVGEGMARATLIVRHAPGTHASQRTLGGGEEFLVLDGVLQDERGDFPAGSYVRNPLPLSHTPSSGSGCTLFVKLGQFAPDDQTQVHLDTPSQAFAPVEARPGVAAMSLFADLQEQVRLEHWAAGAVVNLHAPGGLEVLVLGGEFTESSERFELQSWLQLPAGATLQAAVGMQGCRVWIKAGHAES